uniref:Cytochrome P450 9e2 n=1 Tax=Culex pipiens TaxID=7175 RepID=A0A8D8HDK2_CULPI
MVSVDLFTTLCLGTIIVLVYHYLVKKYHYFLSKPIPCVKPTILVGTSGPLLFRKRDLATHMKVMYNAFPDAKIIGMYDLTSPIYMLRDPDMIKKLAMKDFDHFTDHGPYLTNGRTDDNAGGDSLFGNSLFAMRGQKWRDMRATLSPAFTGSRMRPIFELVTKCGRSMATFFKEEARAGRKLEYEIKDTFQRYGNDVIATVAFGIEVDSMRDYNNEFFEMATKMLSFSSWKMVPLMVIMRVLAALGQKTNMDFMDSKLSDHFKKMIRDNMKQREVNKIVRNDMINILMEVRNGSLKHRQDEQDTKDAGFATVEESSVGKTTHSRKWTDNELFAQCFLFFIAGFDTASTLMSFLAYELSVNPEIQERLHEEIRQTEDSLKTNPLSYEVLQKMQYLDQVVSEALRKWSPNMQLDRYCRKDYLYDDNAGTRFVIEQGHMVVIPVIAMHHDPQYFPEPERFDPERFSEENRSKINTGAYLPFGVGPRNCIGSRLALMEVKSIFYHLVRDFRLVLSEKTQIPLKMAKHPFALLVEGGLWVEFKPRSGINE